MTETDREYSAQKWIDTVQALLTRAMDERTPEAEREVCKSKADAIILKHKLDSYALQQSVGSPAGIIKDEWKWNVPPEFSQELYDLIWVIADHCDLRVLTSYLKVTVVGERMDVEFAQMLWTTLLLEFTSRMYPKWDRNRTFDENVYVMVKGGYKWARIHEEHVQHQAETAPEKLSGRYKTAYHRECKRKGEEPTPHTQRHQAFRASYATSFCRTVDGRLQEMRRRSKEGLGADEDRYALAIRSTKERVNEEFYRLFPQYSPEARAKRSQEAMEAEERRRAAMSQEERDAEDAKYARDAARAAKSWDRLQNKRYDVNGWRAGTKAGNEVDLSGGRNNVGMQRAEVEG